MKSHLRNIHSAIKPLKCDECDKCYKMARNLIVHKIKHSGGYACDTCELKFHSKSQLKEHKSDHDVL